MGEIMGQEPMNEEHRQRGEILLSMLGGLVTTQEAAKRLASLSLRTDNIELTWTTIMDAARKSEDRHLVMLVDLLVCMAKLPPARDDNGEQLMEYDMRIWQDLPTLRWAFNYEWNGLTMPQQNPGRQKAIDGFININKFAACLMKTGLAVFEYDIYVLWTFRSALETPLSVMNPEVAEIPEATIPAATQWIFILGPEIRSWDNEYPHGELEGDPGRGGALWNGQRGFCKGRWELWRSRFAELSVEGQLSDALREICKKAHASMAEIGE